ncbi:transposase [Streptomyces albogriseolus]|uniref:transposase n=1 Tax=Streptomyces albogriseolus TaxID=1887 RepID=UPI0037007AF1
MLESALEGEITDHLDHEKHDPAGKNGGNFRNGTRAMTVLTEVGRVESRLYPASSPHSPQIVSPSATVACETGPFG